MDSNVAIEYAANAPPYSSNYNEDGNNKDLGLQGIMEVMRRKLHIHQMSDWYNVPLILLRETEAKYPHAISALGSPLLQFMSPMPL